MVTSCTPFWTYVTSRVNLWILCDSVIHSPQKVSTLTVTRSPGFTLVTSEPISSTTPTISCPTVIPGTARGTLPCLICRSLVQILPIVTRTMASVGSINIGFQYRLRFLHQSVLSFFDVCVC